LDKYIHPLVSAGFNVLAFDERNHGQSGYAPPITFGYYESHDIPTMIDWLLSMPHGTGGLPLVRPSLSPCPGGSLAICPRKGFVHGENGLLFQTALQIDAIVRRLVQIGPTAIELCTLVFIVDFILAGRKMSSCRPLKGPPH
jgi:hypothetical protein